MAETKIEWADFTHNPWIGCTKVSPACDHCYAEAYATRYNRAEWGAGKPRSLTSDANWKKPLTWARKARCACPPGAMAALLDAGGIESVVARHDAGCPQANRPRVFCASLADVFDTEVPQAWRERLWDLIEATPELDWLLLTKRPHIAARAREDCGLPWHTVSVLPRDGIMIANGTPWPNVWIGTTVEDQKRADVRIDQLVSIPAAKRFLSMEPLLESVNLDRWFGLAPGNTWSACLCDKIDPRDRPCIVCDSRLALGADSRIDWVIVGGESGAAARPMHPDWVRSLRDQCAAAGVPFLVKQWGEHGEDLVRIGKKRTGRELDGVTHDGFPS